MKAQWLVVDFVPAMGANDKSPKCVNLQLLPKPGLMDKYPYFKSSIIFRTNMGCASKTIIIISGKTILLLILKKDKGGNLPHIWIKRENKRKPFLFFIRATFERCGKTPLWQQVLSLSLWKYDTTNQLTGNLGNSHKYVYNKEERNN